MTFRRSTVELMQHEVLTIFLCVRRCSRTYSDLFQSTVPTTEGARHNTCSKIEKERKCEANYGSRKV